MIFLILFSLILLVGFAPIDPIADPTGFVEILVNAISNNEYKLAVALGILGVVSLIRAYGGRLFPILKSGKAAFISGLVLGGIASLVSGMIAGNIADTMSAVKAIVDGMLTALLASGIYSGAKTIKKSSAK